MGEKGSLALDSSHLVPRSPESNGIRKNNQRDPSTKNAHGTYGTLVTLPSYAVHTPYVCSQAHEHTSLEMKEAKDYRGRAKRARRPPSRSPATSPDAAFPIAAPSTSADPAVTTPAAVPAVTTPAAGPSAEPQATNSDDPDNPPAADSCCYSCCHPGRRRRHDCAGRDDEDLLVKFNHAHNDKQAGLRVENKASGGSSGKEAARNIIGPFTPGPTQEAAQAKTLQECFCLFISDELVAQVVQWTNQKIDEIAAKFTRKLRPFRGPQQQRYEPCLVF
ncbi:hypothetical protein GWK47_002726 [Chionoecetes opilio]|uniref:Uncharacterized protein n=1 Tax=Chionoecetes opilio TaxID=41210 RepID=A0A8J4XM60_CHIOP|nr:hypothetical protein GWK47_002726 [Chionoecetes opilio]